MLSVTTGAIPFVSASEETMRLTKAELETLKSMFSEDGRELRLELPIMADATDQLLDAMHKNDDLVQQAHDLAQAMAGDHGDQAGDHGDQGGDHGDQGGDHGDQGGDHGDGGGGQELLDRSGQQADVSASNDATVMTIRELLRRRKTLIDRARNLQRRNRRNP
jgi:hypothetical protein